MRGRSLELGMGNGFPCQGRGEPEGEIRRFACLEKPLRAEGVRTANRHR